MTVTHHPDASTLMSFAAGTLPAALAAAVAGHLSLCPVCRREARLLDAIGAATLRELPGAPLERSPPDSRELPAPDTGPEVSTGPADGEVPFPLWKIIGPRLDDRTWRFQAPGIYQHLIRFPNPSDGILRLIKALPGAAIPEHGHQGTELTLVLRGAYRDRLGAFHRGDMADLDDAVDHTPIADPGAGCICLVASEAPPVFRGLLPRLLRPFLRA
jgi:putative transcriptional regulator